MRGAGLWIAADRAQAGCGVRGWIRKAGLFNNHWRVDLGFHDSVLRCRPCTYSSVAERCTCNEVRGFDSPRSAAAAVGRCLAMQMSRVQSSLSALGDLLLLPVARVATPPVSWLCCLMMLPLLVPVREPATPHSAAQAAHLQVQGFDPLLWCSLLLPVALLLFAPAFLGPGDIRVPDGQMRHGELSSQPPQNQEDKDD